MIPQANGDRHRLILALARARGWKIAAGTEAGDASPSAVLGARWETATEMERKFFEDELAAVEANPALAAVLLGGADEPGSVMMSNPEAMAPTQRPGGGGAVAEPVGTSRGRYEVKKEHARGGMGRVLVVVDHEVGREVAMKELLPKFAEGFAWDRERFLREARITGQLEHPNIVPVYEIGPAEGGAAYYTMKLVRGETMEARIERIQKDKTLTAAQKMAERLKLLDAFIDACNAVAYAHSRWIVNRDLKPANIMIGDFGETVVLDWGLARKLGEVEEAAPKGRASAARAPGEETSKGDTTRLTIDGDIMGTPAYMAPEQARGDIEHVDEKSDVYALGAILFEIVTGRPPFLEPTSLDLLRAVIAQAPPDAGTVEPLAPRELAAVAAAAIVKDRSVRLGSARTLAEEIKAWRDGRPMALYRHNAMEQLRRFARHNRALALALAGAAVILIAGVAVSLTYARLASQRATSERAAHEESDAQTVKALRANEATRAALTLAQGQRLAAYATNLLSENPTAALIVAMESARMAPGSASTNALWGALSNLLERQRFLNHEHNVTDGHFSPDGRLVATAGADFTARIWDVASGKELHRLEGHRSGVTVAEWSADGLLLLTAPGHPEEDRIRAFQPAGCVDVAPRIWDTKTGKCVAVLKGHKGFLRGARWAPGGHVLTWSDDATVRLWDTEGHAVVFAAPWWVWKAVVSPDGRWIAASQGAKGCLWRTDAPGEPRDLPGHTEHLTCMDFSADSKFLVSVDHKGLILRRDVETLAVTEGPQLGRADPKNPKGPAIPATAVFEVLFHPDGTRVAFHATTGLHIWAADLSHEISRTDIDSGYLAPDVLDPDWKRILIRYDVNALARDVATGEDLAWFRGHEYNLEFAHFSTDGHRVITGGRDHTAIVWDADPGACLATFRWHSTQPRAFVSPDGELAMVQGPDKRLEVHDNATGKIVNTLESKGEVQDVHFLGDSGRFGAWTSNYDSFNVGDTRRGWLFPADSGDAHVSQIRSSRNGDWILLVGDGGNARLWDVPGAKGSPVFRCPSHTYDFFAVSNDGRMIAMVESANARVVLYDPDGPREIGRLVGHSGWTICAAFAPDGTVLTTAMDATVRAWDPKTCAYLRSGRWPVIQETRTFASPDGHTVALDGGVTARFYRLDTLDEIASLPRDFSSPVGFTGNSRFAVARRRNAVVQLPLEALAFAETVVPRELTPLEQRGMADTRAEAEAYALAYYRRHPRQASLLARAEHELAEGKWEEALKDAVEAIALLPAHPGAFEMVARSHAAHAAILKESDPARTAAIEAAVQAFGEAAARGYRDVAALEGDATLAVLRNHPRWAALVAAAKKEPWE